MDFRPKPFPDQAVPRGDHANVCAAALSDVGRVHHENQDAYLLTPERGLLAVADGIGGGPAGALAARLSIDCLPKHIEREISSIHTTDHDDSQPEIRDALRRAVTALSQDIGHRSWADRTLPGMGAALVTVLLRGRLAHIASLGDSRAYLLRQNTLRQLTADHNLAALLLRLGEIHPEQAPTHPGGNRLTQYVGMDGEAEPHMQTLALAPGDRLLICTDGLTSMVSDAGIREILLRGADPNTACRELVDAANTAGGRDNITALIADVCPRSSGANLS